MSRLYDRLRARSAGIACYGIAPPKATTGPDSLAAITAQHAARFRALSPDGVVVYDIQPETERASEPRPFPFLPTLDPEDYARVHLASVEAPRIVYRCVPKTSREEFLSWLEASEPQSERFAVLVGAPSRTAYPGGLPLAEAYALVRERAPSLCLGGIAIAERHHRGYTEHLRMVEKMNSGCSFFITQAVYDVATTKSLLSDYALELARLGRAPVPVLLTLSPCGSVKTLEFMKWLGVSFPRWLENELVHSQDVLARSLHLCRELYEELSDFGREKGIPVGFNVESVSIRKAEIEAAVALFEQLRAAAPREEDAVRT